MQGAQQKPMLAASGELAITFIGHASFFLQIGGLNILIDPVFAKWLVLIRRLRRPGACGAGALEGEACRRGGPAGG